MVRERKRHRAWERYVDSFAHDFTPRARAVLAVLFDAAGEEGECEPSVADLADCARVCERTVQRATLDLVAQGWIAVEYRKIGPRMNETNIYRILDEGALANRPRALRAAPKRARRSSSPTPLSPSTSQRLRAFRAPFSAGEVPGSASGAESPAVGVVVSPESHEGGMAVLPIVAEVRAAMAFEDAEAERVLDLIGQPPTTPDPVFPEALTTVTPSLAEVDRLGLEIPEGEQHHLPLKSNAPSLDSTSDAGEGGTPKGGAVAPSQIARGRAGAHTDARHRLVKTLLLAGLVELVGNGFEDRMLSLATRAGTTVEGMLSALRAVGTRRATALEQGGEPAERWRAEVGAVRGYLYVSVRNEIRAAKARWEAACERRSRLQVRGMEERSLDAPGREILAFLQATDVLSGIANPDAAARIARHSADGANGGTLPTADVLFALREVAENERDRRSVSPPRGVPQLMAFIQGCLKNTRPGASKGKKPDGGSGGGTGGGRGGGGRAYQPQATGVTGDVWDW